MELQVMLSDMVRTMDLPHFSDPQQNHGVDHSHHDHRNHSSHHDSSVPVHSPGKEHCNAQASGFDDTSGHSPPTNMLALLGAAAAAASEEQSGTAAVGAEVSRAHSGWSQLSPSSSTSNRDDHESHDHEQDLFWSSDLKLFSAAAAAAAATAVAKKRRPDWSQAADPPPSKLHVFQQLQQRQIQQEVQQMLDGKLAAAAKRRDEKEKAKKETGWSVGDLDTDLEGSLSGLGVDLSGAYSNMGETLLALPSLTVFKQEAPSPSNNDGLQSLPRAGAETSPNSGGNDTACNNSNGNVITSQLHQLLQHAGVYSSVTSTTNSRDHNTENKGGANIGEGFNNNHGPNSSASSPASASSCPPGFNVSTISNQDTTGNIDCRFQYVLAAATSIATKVNEETLTYLNQGQSYEIKLKKLGDLSAYRGKILKSAIRICFHERRLQYTEREQMAAWQASRPGDRIVEVDVPLSYGLLDVIQDPMQLNAVEFLWDPTKEVGVYIKVNCISTEFTPKKHGGEKGVPFRIQVETYLQGVNGLKRLHAAACQIKVFKLKGADRKHKQDREKILKRPLSEQEKFQPSYECTVLSDIPSDALVLPQPVTPIISSTMTMGPAFSPTDAHSAPGRPSTPPSAAGGQPLNQTLGHQNPTNLLPPKEEQLGSSSSVSTAVAILPEVSSLSPSCTLDLQQPSCSASLPPLGSNASAQQTAQWLQAHRFTPYLRTFSSFCGADLLRLTRDDLTQICGLADGIRLYNALHSKAIAPRLTLYLRVEQSTVFHALYLDTFSCNELANKLAHLVCLSVAHLQDVLLQGPTGIHVFVTDDVVRNIHDEAMFSLEVLRDTVTDQYRLLLKTIQR